MPLGPYRQLSVVGIMTASPSSATNITIIEEPGMIEYDLDKENSILEVRPKAALDKQDFVDLAQAVDPLIEAHGDLAGLIVNAASFPGWDSFGSMVTHFRFVRDHHRHVKKVAVVTDSHLGDVAERLASHFVSAEIRHFPAGQPDEARQWIGS
ncbi:STAS/SEC14 domain-containing protein [Mycobacterium ahvazicum]|uniref:STAS/SEC14 domain-containing protein n=2 Tax=Mycobacterium ahvazicum TaxID=1964395 RepID=A0A2K4YBU9_9MYCO|nr:STAS/SEC14 domain-containing protein [Mycobacterium ahvazicum]